MLWILDETERVAAALSNDAPRACPYWADVHTETVAGLVSYDFSTVGDHETSALVVPDALVLFFDLDGDAKLCRVKTIDETRGSDGSHVKTVTSEGAHGELNGSIIRPTTWSGVTAETVLGDVLANTRYQVGDVDYSGDVLTIEQNDYETALGAIVALVAATGLEMRVRYEFDGNRLTGRFVDLVTRLGRDTGKSIEYRKDARSIKRSGDSSGVVTALIGVGKTDEAGVAATFGSVVWTVAGGDPTDKPDDQDWVGDEEARERFGILQSDGTRSHVYGVFRDGEETSPTKLLDKTYAALGALSAPAYTYDVDAALLDRLPAQRPEQGPTPYAHERVSLGDTVRVRDLTFSPPLESDVRITEIRRSYTDPSGGGVSV